MLRFLPDLLPDAELHFAVGPLGVDVLRSLVGDVPTHVVTTRAVPRVAVALPSLARRVRADVIFTQYQIALSRIPSAVLIHDISAEDPHAAAWLSRRRRLRYRATYRSGARFASRLLTVSDYTKQQMVQLYGLDPATVDVAPNAVDPALATLLAVPRERRPGVVLAAGNVLPRKNLVTLARGVRMLVDDGMDVRLRVVGQVPPEGLQDRSAMEDALGDRVGFTGYVTMEQLAEEYTSADVFACPSLYEGFGIPVLEAMAAGTPVLVSDRTSLPEVAGDAALVVPGEDPGAWAQALRQALTDEGCRRKLVEAGARRQRDYDWRSSAAVVAGSLRTAAASRG